QLTRLPIERCVAAIQRCLLAGYECKPDPSSGRPPFAFRLHQFISKGDTIYASLEADARFLTLQGQRFVPGRQRQSILLPLVFCRECGQEYYCVRLVDQGSRWAYFTPRELTDRSASEGSLPGYLYFSTASPWPDGDRDAL